MCGYCSTDGKCAVSKNGREPDICANIDTEHCLYKEYAERLIESGYGDISEYKAEIEQLKAENYELTKKLEARLTCDFVKTAQKHAKIDVLNRVMTYINNKIENDYGDMSDSVQYLTINIYDFDDFIDELIKGVVENEN